MNWVLWLPVGGGAAGVGVDALVIAGDVAETRDNFARTMAALRERFGAVFYVPGNHDLWLRHENGPYVSGFLRIFHFYRSFLPSLQTRFHTYHYARHFVSACTRILGLEGTPESVEDQGRLTRVSAFPIGIYFERFKRALELTAVKRHINELTHHFAGRKVRKLLSLNSLSGWRTMFGFSVIPSILLALGMAVSPEIPCWLFQQGKLSQAEAAIKKLYGKEKVAEVMYDLKAGGQGSSEPDASWFDLFRKCYRKGSKVP
ncbi:hypothetical protein ABZP36_008983 [Zizania latifolia]